MIWFFISLFAQIVCYGFFSTTLLIWIFKKRDFLPWLHLDFITKTNNSLFLINLLLLYFGVTKELFIAWYSGVEYESYYFSMEINWIFWCVAVGFYVFPLILFFRKARESLKISTLIIAVQIICYITSITQQKSNNFQGSESTFGLKSLLFISIDILVYFFLLGIIYALKLRHKKDPINI